MARIICLVVTCAVFGVCSCFNFTEYYNAIEKFFANLGEYFGNSITVNPQHHFEKRIGNHENWCCDLYTKVRYKGVSEKILVSVKVTERFNKGSHGCGFLSLNRCHSYDVRYVLKSQYRIITKRIPQHEECPASHLKCCAGYQLFAGQCIDKERLTDPVFREQLERLKENGIPFGR